jgi:hypothetical protein
LEDSVPRFLANINLCNILDINPNPKSPSMITT